jgi:hypothetical protein
VLIEAAVRAAQLGAGGIGGRSEDDRAIFQPVAIATPGDDRLADLATADGDGVEDHRTFASIFSGFAGRLFGGGGGGGGGGTETGTNNLDGTTAASLSARGSSRARSDAGTEVTDADDGASMVSDLSDLSNNAADTYGGAYGNYAKGRDHHNTKKER